MWNRLATPMLAVVLLLGAGCIVVEGDGRHDDDRHHEDRYDGDRHHDRNDDDRHHGDRDDDDRHHGGGHHGGSHGSLGDLVDMRARSGERELEERGYRHHKTTKIRNSSIGYWWNSRRDECIAVTTKDGHYSSIMDQPDAMCGE